MFKIINNIALLKKLNFSLLGVVVSKLKSMNLKAKPPDLKFRLSLTLTVVTWRTYLFVPGLSHVMKIIPQRASEKMKFSQSP